MNKEAEDKRVNSGENGKGLQCVAAKAGDVLDQHLTSDYFPTPSELKLLEALLDADNRHKTITELCRTANVDRSMYYDAIKKPDFMALYRKLILEMVKSQAAPVINTFLREAKRGSFQHGKVILEMAEMYSEKANQPEIPSITVNVMVATPTK